MTQRYIKILEDCKITSPFSTIAICMADNDKLVVYCCRDTATIKLLFLSVIAYRSHDDFHHPDIWLENKTEYPKTNDDKYPYPALEVLGSDWLYSFPGYQSRFRGKQARHYRLASYNNVVDILTLEKPIESAATSDVLGELKTLTAKGR